MSEIEVKIVNRLGLHARAAARFPHGAVGPFCTRMPCRARCTRAALSGFDLEINGAVLAARHDGEQAGDDLRAQGRCKPWMGIRPTLHSTRVLLREHSTTAAQNATQLVAAGTFSGASGPRLPPRLAGNRPPDVRGDDHKTPAACANAPEVQRSARRLSGLWQRCSKVSVVAEPPGGLRALRLRGFWFILVGVVIPNVLPIDRQRSGSGRTLGTPGVPEVSKRRSRRTRGVSGGHRQSCELALQQGTDAVSAGLPQAVVMSAEGFVGDGTGDVESGLVTVGSEQLLQ